MDEKNLGVFVALPKFLHVLKRKDSIHLSVSKSKGIEIDVVS